MQGVIDKLLGSSKAITAVVVGVIAILVNFEAIAAAPEWADEKSLDMLFTMIGGLLVWFVPNKEV